MTSDRGRIGASAALVVIAAGLTWGMALGRARSDLLFYGCAFAQAGLALAAGRIAVGPGARAALMVLIGGAILLRLWLVLQVPTLSGDLYRYIWDGRVVNAGFNPYLHVPADPMLVTLRDPQQYGLIDKRDYAVTIYPPVAQALFAMVTRLSGSVWAMKLAMVLLEGVAVLAMLSLLRRLDRPSGHIAVYLLHPAPLWEIAGNGHVDAAMMAFLFGALALRAGGFGPHRSAVVMTLGALIKPTAALGLPALWRPMQIVLPLTALAVALLTYVPFLGAGAGVAGFLPNYAHEQGLDTGEGFYWMVLLQHLGLFQPAMTAGYIGLAGLVLLGLSLWSRRTGASDLRTQLSGTALLLMAFLLLLTPTFPWYFLPALPLSSLLGLWSPFVLATGGVLLYGFNPDAPPLFGRWSLVVGLTLAAALYDLRGNWRRKVIP